MGGEQDEENRVRLNEKLDSYEKSKQIRPVIQSLLGRAPLTGTNAGKQLLDLLNSGDIKQLQISKEGGADKQIDTFKNILGKKGFGQEQIDNIIVPLQDLAKKAGVEVSDIFGKVFDSKYINQFRDSAELASKTGQQYVEALSKVNQDLISLTQETEKSVGQFDVNVIKRLSSTLTGIDVGGINRRGKSQIEQLESGSNDYFKNFASYRENISGNTDAFNSGKAQLSSKFEIDTAELLGDSINNILTVFNKSAISDKLTKRDANAVNSAFGDSFNQIGNIFQGIAEFKTDKSGKKSVDFSQGFANISPDRVGEISKQLFNKTNELEGLYANQSLIENISDLLGRNNGKTLSEIKLNPDNTQESNIQSGIDYLGQKNSPLQKILINSGKDKIDALKLDSKDRDALIQSIREFNNQLNKSVLNYNKVFEQLNLNLESGNSKAAAEFTNNRDLLSRQFAISQSNIRQGGIISRGNISTQGTLGRRQIGSSPFQVSELQGQQAYQNELANTRANLSTQIPGVDFSNVDKSGLNNLITAQKSKVSKSSYCKEQKLSTKSLWSEILPLKYPLLSVS